MSNSPSDDQCVPSTAHKGTSLWSAVEQIEEALAHLKTTAASADEPRRVDRASQARALVEARRLRSEVISPMVFSDPAWDILLELYTRELEERPVNISRLTAAVPVAATTTLRWIEKLEEEALIRRRADERHKKRVWIELSQYGRSLMDRYFATCSSRGLF